MRVGTRNVLLSSVKATCFLSKQCYHTWREMSLTVECCEPTDVERRQTRADYKRRQPIENKKKQSWGTGIRDICPTLSATASNGWFLSGRQPLLLFCFSRCRSPNLRRVCLLRAWSIGGDTGAIWRFRASVSDASDTAVGEDLAAFVARLLLPMLLLLGLARPHTLDHPTNWHGCSIAGVPAACCPGSNSSTSADYTNVEVSRNGWLNVTS